MNQNCTITIQKTVTIAGNSSTSVISVNCATPEIEAETARLVETMRHKEKKT